METPAERPYRVELPFFEGPLDLLLHLVRKHELDILDIPIAFVTEKYLEYLEVMRTLQLDVASEYLVMAATLAHIKSRMLVPTPTEEGDEGAEGEELDPRMELVRRLLEYQRYKEAAENLLRGSLLSRDVFLRGAPPPVVDGEAPLAEMDVLALVEAFKTVLDRVQIEDVAHEVTIDRISVSERIGQLSDVFALRRRLTFLELFEGSRTRYDVVVTFLAVLEMARLRLLRVYQAAAGEPIHLAVAVAEDGEGNAGTGTQDPPPPAPRGEDWGGGNEETST